MNGDQLLEQLITFSDNMCKRLESRRTPNLPEVHLQIISKLKNPFLQYEQLHESISSQQNDKLMSRNKRQPLQERKRQTNKLVKGRNQLVRDWKHAGSKVVPLCASESYDYRNTEYYAKQQEKNTMRVQADQTRALSTMKWQMIEKLKMQFMPDVENDCAQQILNVFNKWQQNDTQMSPHSTPMSSNTTSPSSIRVSHKAPPLTMNDHKPVIFNLHHPTNNNPHHSMNKNPHHSMNKTYHSMNIPHNSISLSSKLNKKTTRSMLNQKTLSDLRQISEASHNIGKGYKCFLCSISSFPTRRALYLHTRSTKHKMLLGLVHGDQL